MAAVDELIPDTIKEQTLINNPSGSLISGDLIQNTANGGYSYKNPYLELNNQTGLFGVTNGQWNNLGQAAGLAGTAYGLYDNILGNKAQMYKLQKSALQQNMANIAEDRAAHKAFQGNFGSGINSAMGNGLAGSAIKK